MVIRTLGKFIYSTVQNNTTKNLRCVTPVLRLYSTPATGTQGMLFIQYS